VIDYTYIGILLAAISFIISIIGSWYVSGESVSNRKVGFKLWMIGNPITIVVLIGVMLNIWNTLPLIFTLIMQCYFLYTAYRGYKSNVVIC